MRARVWIVSLLFLLAAVPDAFALPRPQLYPNQHLQQVGQSRADRDVNECSVNANDYLSKQGGSESAGVKVAKDAIKGAAAGALGATIMKQNAGRGAGAGAAIGGLRGLGAARKTEKEGSPEYRQYVEACLEDRGYKVIGWK